jgi:cell wall-associated NlpC family hydrolase
MSKREDFVTKALNEVGYVEGPKDNETKYGAFTKANFQPWCGSFVMWCANEVGLKIPSVVSTSLGVSKFQGLGAWSIAETYKPQSGDLVFFDFVKGGNPIDHVGIVVKDNGDGTITTVEGNTSGDKKKASSERNGGEVVQKIRGYRANNKKKLPVFIVGFGSPKFN